MREEREGRERGGGKGGEGERRGKGGREEKRGKGGWRDGGKDSYQYCTGRGEGGR